MSQKIFRGSPHFPPTMLDQKFKLYYRGGGTSVSRTIPEDWTDFGTSNDIIAYKFANAAIAEETASPKKNVKHFLEDALFALDDRAAERDSEAERSMAAAVNSFNAMFGTNLTEEQGWQFMVFLKISRSKQGKFKADDYTDMAAYAALSGEAAAKARS